MTATEAFTSRRWPITIQVRPDTSDVKAAHEVLNQNAYQRPRLGFRFDTADRWLDAGANIGAFSVAAAWHQADLVVAVEPLPVHLELLRSNLASYPRAAVLAGAVTPPGHTGPVVIHQRDDPTQQWRSSSVRPIGDTTPHTVDAYPIDRLVDEHRLNAIKLDIEGAEIDILESWEPPAGVRKLVVEWSFDVDDSTARPRAVLKRWAAAGYTVNYHVHLDTRDRWTGFPAASLFFAWRP